MVEWSLIIYCGLITFLSRYLMIAILKKEMFTDRVREVLSFVPSAIFPAIIFPAIFLDMTGDLLIENNPKIFAAIIAIIIGLVSKNVVATIFSGLISYLLFINQQSYYFLFLFNLIGSIIIFIYSVFFSLKLKILRNYKKK